MASTATAPVAAMVEDDEIGAQRGAACPPYCGWRRLSPDPSDQRLPLEESKRDNDDDAADDAAAATATEDEGDT